LQGLRSAARFHPLPGVGRNEKRLLEREQRSMFTIFGRPPLSKHVPARPVARAEKPRVGPGDRPISSSQASMGYSAAGARGIARRCSPGVREPNPRWFFQKFRCLLRVRQSPRGKVKGLSPACGNALQRSRVKIAPMASHISRPPPPPKPRQSQRPTLRDR